MSQENEREGLLRALERIRATATRLESELVELHNVVRFHHRSQGARDRARSLENELAQLAAALRQFREHCEQEPAAQ